MGKLKACKYAVVVNPGSQSIIKDITWGEGNAFTVDGHKVPTLINLAHFGRLYLHKGKFYAIAVTKEEAEELLEVAQTRDKVQTAQ